MFLNLQVMSPMEKVLPPIKKPNQLNQQQKQKERDVNDEEKGKQQSSLLLSNCLDSLTHTRRASSYGSSVCVS